MNNSRKGNAMKYKVNKADRVNTDAAKSGIKWRYSGKVDDWKKAVNDYEESRKNGWARTTVGIRITDETGTVIFEKIYEEI